MQPLGFNVNFFGTSYNSVYVNNNGNLTFGGPSDRYTPEGLAGIQRPIIAPFFADVDTTATASSQVTFGQDTVGGRPAFGVNYVNVGYFDGHGDKLNSFQVILIDRSDTGTGNFDIEFNYDRIAWETGDADDGVSGLGGIGPSVGYSNGTLATGTYFELPGSLRAGSFLDSASLALIRQSINSGFPGRLIFQARAGGVATCTLACTASVPAAAGAGLPVAFSSSATPSNCTGTPTFIWNFGDGSPTSTLQNPTHAYASAGTYSWSMTTSVSGTTCQKAGSIGVSGAGQFSVDPGSLVFEAVAGFGNPPSQNLRIRNGGTAAANFTAQPDAASPWLTVSPASGTVATTTPAVIQVTVNVGALAPGTYSGVITLQIGGAPRTVPVSLILTQSPQIIFVSRSGLLFTGVEGGAVLPTQSFGVVNPGRNALNWTAQATTISGGNWLSVSPASGASAINSTVVPQVDVRVDSTGLAAGAYSGTVQVSSTGAVNSPQTVAVFLTILPRGGNPGIQVQPTALLFVTTQGGTPPAQTVSLGRAAPGSVGVTATAATSTGADWLSVFPGSGTLSAGTPLNLTVQTTPSSLPGGVYQGTITLQFDDGSSRTVNVSLVVVSTTSPSGKGPGMAAACTPAQLVAVVRSIGTNFSSVASWPTNIEAQVVDNCGTPRTDATVVATFSNGDSPLVLVSLRNGTYSGTWRPISQTTLVNIRVRATLPPLTAAETVLVGQVSANATAPVLYPGGIVHAASFAPGAPLSPGSIVSLFGSKMATADAASRIPLPTTLGNTTLRVGDTLVPLYVSTDGQINAQIPVELTAPAAYQMVLRTPTLVTVPEPFNLSLTRPGIFTINQQGSGQAAVFNTRGQVVDSVNPAAAGDVVVIYATGLGATNPVVASGAAAPSAEPLARVTNAVTATVGGQNAPVQFAGQTPGFVALYQINVQIPGGVAPGLADLVVTQRDVPSNTVTIAVK